MLLKSLHLIGIRDLIEEEKFLDIYFFFYFLDFDKQLEVSLQLS